MTGDSDGRETSTAQRALECLRQLALQQGLDDVSMRDVARGLGISLAALQYHYPNKAALLEAFVREAAAGYHAEIEAVFAAAPKGERFSALVRFAVRETLAWERSGLLAMIEGRARHDEAANHAMQIFFSAYLDIMREALLADAPDLPPARALVTVTLVVSMLEGMPSLIQAAEALGADRDTIVNSVLDAAQTLADVRR